jgi:hypothetical protein
VQAQPKWLKYGVLAWLRTKITFAAKSCKCQPILLIMSYHNLIFTLLVVFLSQEVLMSQTMDPIGAARPGAGDSPTITPKGYFQGEQGVGYEQLDKDNESFVLPTI